MMYNSTSKKISIRLTVMTMVGKTDSRRWYLESYIARIPSTQEMWVSVFGWGEGGQWMSLTHNDSEFRNAH